MLRGDYEEMYPDDLGRWRWSELVPPVKYVVAAIAALAVACVALAGGAFGADPLPQAPPVQAPPVKREATQTRPPAKAAAAAPAPVISYARAREIAPDHGGIVVIIGDVRVPPHEHFYGAPVYRIREGTWPPSVEPGIYHVSRVGGVPMWWRSDWPQYIPAPASGVPAVPFGPGTTAPSAAGPSITSPAPARGPAPTFTLAPPATRGGTTTGDPCPT